MITITRYQLMKLATHHNNQNQNQKKLYCQVRFYTYEEFAVVILVHAVNKLLKLKI